MIDNITHITANGEVSVALISGADDFISGMLAAVMTGQSLGISVVQNDVDEEIISVLGEKIIIRFEVRDDVSGVPAVLANGLEVRPLECCGISDVYVQAQIRDMLKVALAVDVNAGVEVTVARQGHEDLILGPEEVQTFDFELNSVRSAPIISIEDSAQGSGGPEGCRTPLDGGPADPTPIILLTAMVFRIVEILKK